MPAQCDLLSAARRDDERHVLPRGLRGVGHPDRYGLIAPRDHSVVTVARGARRSIAASPTSMRRIVAGASGSSRSPILVPRSAHSIAATAGMMYGTTAAF